MRRAARLAPQPIDVEIVQDREQPLARVVALAPLLEAGQRPFQGILDQVVGLAVVAQERARVASKPRDLGSNRFPASGQADPLFTHANIHPQTLVPPILFHSAGQNKVRVTCVYRRRPPDIVARAFRNVLSGVGW